MRGDGRNSMLDVTDVKVATSPPSYKNRNVLAMFQPDEPSCCHMFTMGPASYVGPSSLLSIGAAQCAAHTMYTFAKLCAIA